jgi:hypothetical protein
MAYKSEKVLTILLNMLMDFQKGKSSILLWNMLKEKLFNPFSPTNFSKQAIRGIFHFKAFISNIISFIVFEREKMCSWKCSS